MILSSGRMGVRIDSDNLVLRRSTYLSGPFNPPRGYLLAVSYRTIGTCHAPVL